MKNEEWGVKNVRFAIMKRAFFVCLLMLSGIAMFAQDNTSQSYASLLIREDSKVWHSNQVSLYDNNAARILPKGTRVMGRVAAIRDKINGVFDYIASIYYNDERYDIRTSDLSPIRGRLPSDWLTASDTQRKWVISFYLDVLRSQNRDTFLNYEKPWIDYATAEKEYNIIAGSIPDDSTWYNSPFKFESLVFFDAVIIMGGFALCEFFITEIIPFNTGFKITLTGDYWFIEGRNFSWPGTGLPFPNWSERRSFDMIFIPDGDYMDVYLDSLDNHFATFVKVDNVILEELENLIYTNKVDLAKITSWPRRADGSMDYPPPGVSTAPIAPKEEKQPEPIIELSVNSADTEVQQNETTQNSAKKSALPLWAWIVIIGLEVAVTGGVVLFIVKWRKRRFSA